MLQTLYSGPIAGVSHAKPDFDELTFGDTVALRADPKNAFDPHAVLVLHPTAGRLGYIPKESTVVFHDAWRNGLPPTATVTAFDNSGKWPKIHLTVTVEL